MTPKGIGWRSSSSGASETIDAPSLSAANWIRTGKHFQLEVIVKGGTNIKFDGFREQVNLSQTLSKTNSRSNKKKQDFESLNKYFSSHFNGITLNTLQLSTKGWNWGKPDFQGTMMTFNVGGRRAFEIPLGDISRSVHHTGASKNDVSIEFPDNGGGGVGSAHRRSVGNYRSGIDAAR